MCRGPETCQCQALFSRNVDRSMVHHTRTCSLVTRKPLRTVDSSKFRFELHTQTKGFGFPQSRGHRRRQVKRDCGQPSQVDCMLQNRRIFLLFPRGIWKWSRPTSVANAMARSGSVQMIKPDEQMCILSHATSTPDPGVLLSDWIPPTPTPRQI